MSITRKLLQDIRPEMDEVLKPLAEKYGITIQVGNGSYGGLTGHLKVMFSTTNEEGEDQRAIDYKRYASLYNLEVEWLIQSFVQGSETYTIVGLDLKKRKNMLVLRRERDGQIRIAPTRMANYNMNKGKARVV